LVVSAKRNTSISLMWSTRLLPGSMGGARGEGAGRGGRGARACVRACVRACTRRLTCPLLPDVNVLAWRQAWHRC
jgi:hypothetical protein